MSFFKKYSLIFLLTALSGGTAIAEEGAPKTTLVLDASGSMWGQIDGKAKITIAQEVISDLVQSLPRQTELGLTVYGHRRKGDCSDIESLIQPSPGSRDAIIHGVNTIRPKGKTPLSAAVLQAARELRHTEEKATVVLVSDGEETCSLDPCTVGRELEETGVDFTVHVVGFDIADAQTRAQLQCLADETGGQYLNADNAASLTNALTKVTAVVPQPAPVPAPQPQRASVNGPTKAEAGAIISVSWEGPANKGDHVGVLLKGEDDIATARQDVRNGSPLDLKVPPQVGKHELIYFDYQAQTITARVPFEVLAVTASLSASETAIAGGTLEVAWTGPGNEKDYIAIAIKDDVLPHYSDFFHVSEGPESDLRVPSKPGDYELRYIAHTEPRVMLASRPVKVEDVALKLKAPKTAKAGGKIQVLWNGTSNPKDYIAFAVPGEPFPHVVTMAETLNGNPLTVPVPDKPGDYELRYFFAAGDRIVKSLPITVK